jgi:hypothetical protein
MKLTPRLKKHPQPPPSAMRNVKLHHSVISDDSEAVARLTDKGRDRPGARSRRGEAEGEAGRLDLKDGVGQALLSAACTTSV